MTVDQSRRSKCSYGHSSKQISYDEANTGHLTVYLPENRNNTEISVTVPGLNGGNPITASGKTISTTTPNEIEMFYDNTFCSHEYYNADGFCEACGAYQKAISRGNIMRFIMPVSFSGLQSSLMMVKSLIRAI